MTDHAPTPGDEGGTVQATSQTVSKPATTAWQPFTPGGVASFAPAPSSRVVILKTFVALVAAITVVWFLRANYFPSISEALKKLPEGAALQNATLTNVNSTSLSQKKFLSIAIDLEETGQIGQTADVRLELRGRHFQICSIFDCAMFDYPRKTILLGRTHSEPWFGARRPVILAICGGVTFVGVWLAWIALAMVYAPIAKLIAYCNDRELSWIGSWRLANAAQMTGALLMSLAIFCYGHQVFDLIRFMFFFSLHFLVAWIYIGSAPFSLPHISATGPVSKNPFH